MRGQRDKRRMEDVTNEVTMEELQEFLEGGDLLDAPADPDFKERLRGQLWEIVRLRFRKRRSDT